jgi:uncharacterized membrane protein
MSGIIFMPTHIRLTPLTPINLTCHCFSPAGSPISVHPPSVFWQALRLFFIGKRKTKKELSIFLLKRGIWLVLIELTIVNFAWYFDLQFRTFGLLVIWSLGVSMITLALLIHLPKNSILALSLILIFGHNLFDTVNITNLFWGILHRQTFYPLNDHTSLLVGYPLVPWIAIMSLGYYFGSFYDGSYTAQDRKKTFTIIGIAALLLFIGLRAENPCVGGSIPPHTTKKMRRL